MAVAGALFDYYKKGLEVIMSRRVKYLLGCVLLGVGIGVIIQDLVIAGGTITKNIPLYIICGLMVLAGWGLWIKNR